MKVEGTYLRTFGLGLIGFLFLAGIFNAIMDPYAVFGTPRVSGVNAHKPSVATHALLAKTYQLARARPRAVLIGSSRVDVGLDPASSVWPSDFRPVFNFGVPGSSTEGHLEQFRQAIERGGLRFALVVLDFENALARHPPVPLASDGTPRATTLDRWRASAKDVFLATLTMSALKDSALTLLRQGGGDVPDTREDGRSNEARFRRELVTGGYAGLFEPKNLEIAARNLNAVRQQASEAESIDVAVELVRRMILLASTNDIRLVLVIPPFHADALELFDLAGLWPRFEAWKRSLASTIAAHASTSAALWDFSAFDLYATEPVPDRRERTRAVEWFWEPNHFKSALGELLLRRVLGDDQPAFGARITAGNVEGHLAELRRQRDAYRTLQPEARTRLEAVHRQAASSHR